jgi:hypothetical protein
VYNPFTDQRLNANYRRRRRRRRCTKQYRDHSTVVQFTQIVVDRGHKNGMESPS